MAKGRPTTAKNVEFRKVPNVVENPESYFDKSPSWRFSRADFEHERWSVLDAYEDVVEDPSEPSGTRVLHQFSRSIERQLLEELRPREVSKWGELLSQAGGRGKNGGTNSHHIPIKELTKEAQARAAKIGIEADELMSVRLTSKRRVFGILEGGVLNIIWLDRDHEICPVNRN